jgi:hypothetical protein
VLLGAALATLVLPACVTGGNNTAGPPSSTGAPKGATTTSGGGAGASGAPGGAGARLPDRACELSASQAAKLSPGAALKKWTFTDIAARSAGGDVVLDDEEPFYLDVGATGTLVRCRYTTGNGETTAGSVVRVVVVDFTGGVNEAPPPELAKKAFAKIRDGLVQGKLSGTPQPLSGIGDEALGVSTGSDPRRGQRVVVARAGEVLVVVYTQNNDDALDLTQVDAIAREVLDAAVAVVAARPPVTTTTIAASPSNSVVTTGGVSATWVIRTEDIEVARCSADPPAVEIPLKSTDGSKVATLRAGFGGDPQSIQIFSSAFSISGRGGFTLSVSGDLLHPKVKLKLDSTLKDDKGSAPPTTAKGSLAFTC